ncbi:MAG: ABC transporter substrate-binding protein [Chloroflexota bacterium]
MKRLLLAILLLALGLTPALAQDDTDGDLALRIAGTCAANSHMMPFWVLMEQTGGEIDGVTIEYMPVTGPPQMMALAVNQDFDVMIAFIFQGANFFTAGGAESLRVETVSMWRGFALLTAPDVESWEDLVGQRILLPQEGSGPDVITRRSMESAGYDPFEDFQIEYMPPAQMGQLLIAGEAAAATISEPQLTIIAGQARQNGVMLAPSTSIDLLQGIYESELWEEGRLPLGAVMVDTSVLEDEDMAAAYAAFNASYHEAAAFAQENPAEAAAMIVAQLEANCDSRANPDPIERALAGDFLIYDPVPASALLPDLAEFVNLLYGEDVDESFYAVTSDE